MDGLKAPWITAPSPHGPCTQPHPPTPLCSRHSCGSLSTPLPRRSPFLKPQKDPFALFPGQLSVAPQIVCWVPASALEVGAREGQQGHGTSVSDSNRPLDQLAFVTGSCPLAGSSRVAVKRALGQQRSCAHFSPKDLLFSC